MLIALIAVLLVLLYHDALLSYWGENYYQEHFVFLWAFLILALTQSLRRPFRKAFSLANGRDLVGITLALLAGLLCAVSQLAGSLTGTRSSLVFLCTAAAVIAVPNWSLWRCLMHGLLLQLCFGIPHAVFFQLTQHLQNGVASVVAWPEQLGLLDYEVHGTVVRFPHYDLHITPDCSGVTQIFTFIDIAALGVLSSESSRLRTLSVFLLALLLAWLANMARVAAFVVLVGVGWTTSVDDPWWHAGIGFCVYLPFVSVLVATLVKTHKQIPRRYVDSAPLGSWSIAWLALPALLAAAPAMLRDNPQLSEPSYFASLQAPPGHRLDVRAESEEADRLNYETEWLMNARFRDQEEGSFDLLHYATDSTKHLCVHHVSSCMYWPEQREVKAPPIVVGGRSWWRFGLERPAAKDTVHVYYAFDIDGAVRDDSFWTQVEVFGLRVMGAAGVVRLTRVTFPGSLPDQLTPYERTVLTWIGRTTQNEGR